MCEEDAVDTGGAQRNIAAVTASRESASPPPAPAGGVSLFAGPGEPVREDAALYVDGFNLYHAIDGLGQPHLKWLDLWALGERLIPRKSQRLRKVVYCSAKKPGDPGKIQRHQEYINALQWRGVMVVLGNFLSDARLDCRRCGNFWHPPREKETDLNLGLTLYDDAYQGVFQHSYLLSADSDQAATARMFKMRFPAKTLTTVAPPGMVHSKAVLTQTSNKVSLNASHLEWCLFPGMQTRELGGKTTLVFRRPAEYAPPSGWVPPAQRPARSK